MGGLIVFLVVLLIGAARPFTSSSLRSRKPAPRAMTNLDEYDFGEDEDDDEDELAPEVDDDTGEVEADR